MPVTYTIAASAGLGSDGYGGWRALPMAAGANGKTGTRLHVPSASLAA